jgi:hypothetical protein
MTDVRQWPSANFATSGRQGQIVFLAYLADRFALLARDTYNEDGGVADPARLRAFNEAQHRVSAQLLALLTGSDRRYPDDVSANILADQFAMLHITADHVIDDLRADRPAA